MLALLASVKTARFWLKAAPWLALALAVLGFVLWVRGMQSKIEQQGATITAQATQVLDLKQAVATETEARRRDVAGLTTLSSGLLAASSAKDKDQAALEETIDAAHPTPVSAGLAALLGCLRQADDNKQCAATARTGGPAAGGTAGSH